MRKVLYGGFREVDTDTTTILRRAYIPQDAHSWAKEYTSVTVDGYDIADYTPLVAPAPGRRHFFGNTTANANISCVSLDNCSDRPPQLQRPPPAAVGGDQQQPESMGMGFEGTPRTRWESWGKPTRLCGARGGLYADLSQWLQAIPQW